MITSTGTVRCPICDVYVHDWNTHIEHMFKKIVELVEQVEGLLEREEERYGGCVDKELL